MTWLVITTKRGEEVRMYRAMIDAGMCDDAWLPTALMLIRTARRGTSNGGMREQWRCVLPKTFFARIAPENRHRLAYLKEPTHIIRDGVGAPVTVPDAQIVHYRAALDTENRERAVLASRLNAREERQARKAQRLPDSLKRKTASKRLRKAGKAATEIRTWGRGLTAHDLSTGRKVLTSASPVVPSRPDA